MAWAYHLGTWRKVVNLNIRALLRLGMTLPHTYLLSVRGRKTGATYSTPVTLVERGWRSSTSSGFENLKDFTKIVR